MLVVCWGVVDRRRGGGETERSCRVVRDRRRSAEHHSTVADSVRRQAAQQIRQLRRRQFTFALNTHRTRNDMLYRQRKCADTIGTLPVTWQLLIRSDKILFYFSASTK